MGFRLPRIVNAMPSLKRSLSSSETTMVLKGHYAIYVREVDEKNALTIPCSEEAFIDLTCNLQSS
ncbi:hypothetical protein Gotur_001126 [Gossypium turneri]